MIATGVWISHVSVVGSTGTGLTVANAVFTARLETFLNAAGVTQTASLLPAVRIQHSTFSNSSSTGVAIVR
jgi:hypothetical protein